MFSVFALLKCPYVMVYVSNVNQNTKSLFLAKNKVLAETNMRLQAEPSSSNSSG